MLALDDPFWSQLNHAYGPASDIPNLLRNLALAPRMRSDDEAEPWHTLWSSLCHQGDVYTASYAAVPHLLQIAINTPGPIDWSFFGLPAAIEIARFNQRGPAIPPELVVSYEKALNRLMDCVIVHRADAWDESMALSVITALTAAKGHHRLAEALLNLDKHWITKIINQED